jgi:AcrR family transcriptional regulator
MSARPTKAATVEQPTAPRAAHRGTASKRLLQAVTELAAADGYGQLTVARVLSAAATSRATFYQYFTSIEDCFLTAYRFHSERLLEEVKAIRVVGDHELAILGALVDMAVARPNVAGLLMTQGLAAGPTGLRERDVLIAGIEQAILAARRGCPGIDLPPTVLLGAAFRLISIRLADGEIVLELREELFEWARAFPARPAHAPGWTELLAPGVSTPSRSASARSHALARETPSARERILRATALALSEKGYRSTSVADIVGGAGVSRRLFYNNFQSKRDAVLAAFEHARQALLAACAPAFFDGGSWPERVWSSSFAFIGYLAGEPAFAHLGFVESMAVDVQFARRAEQTQLAFTLFLQEGYRQGGGEGARSRADSALTATAIMELCFQATRRGANPHLRLAQPFAVHLALTPFLGSEASGHFIAAKLARPRRAARSTRSDVAH